jgi:hypothetical protein
LPNLRLFLFSTICFLLFFNFEFCNSTFERALALVSELLNTFQLPGLSAQDPAVSEAYVKMQTRKQTHLHQLLKIILIPMQVLLYPLDRPVGMLSFNQSDFITDFHPTLSHDSIFNQQIISKVTNFSYL